jgi:hypothetical protein
LLIGGCTVEELQQRMSMEEFVMWQAWLRRNPRGFKWENWVQASLAREIHRTIPRAKGSKMPKLDAFLFRASEPLFVERLKREARAKPKKAK